MNVPPQAPSFSPKSAPLKPRLHDRVGAACRVRHYSLLTVQELQGHATIETKMIYTDVLNKGGQGVRSPLDRSSLRKEALRRYFAPTASSKEVDRNREPCCNPGHPWHLRRNDQRVRTVRSSPCWGATTLIDRAAKHLFVRAFSEF